MSCDVTLGVFVKLSNVHLFGACLNTPEHSFGDGITRRSPASQSARIRRHVPHCGGWLVCRAVAPFRVVKMQRCSFTPRFASKTIRSLAHFHDAGDEGNALVMIRRQCRRLQVAAIGVPTESIFGGVKICGPRKLDEALSRHGRRARRVAFLSPRAVFGQYCSPHDYLYARLKLYQKGRKAYPHFRRTALFPSGGGKPEWGSPQNRRRQFCGVPGLEGEQHSPRDVHSISRLSTTKPAGRG